MIEHPFGVTIFSDDVRQEVSGKISIIGVYQNRLIIEGKPPQVLPKLAFSFFFVIPAAIDFKQGAIRVFSEASGQREIVLDETFSPPSKEEMGSATFFRIVWSTIVSPFMVIHPLKLRARALLDDVEIPAGVLEISFTDNNTSGSDSSLPESTESPSIL